jgi:signal transduction histidine kinase
MIETLRRRFIAFSVLVISCIVLVVALVIFLGSDSERSPHGYVFTLLLLVVMVFVGSWLLSKLAIRPIKAAWQQQLDFTADASHELRTPIAVIQTNLELVLDSPDESVQSQARWLQNIATETKRMSRLVEDLLTLSRADTNQQTLEYELFMLDELCHDTLAPFMAIAKVKGITLEANLAEHVAFYGDKKRLKQLITILLDNALHYTTEGSVALTLSQDARVITLTVADTGAGIAKTELDKVFERFYRSTGTRRLHPEGSGLGLAIAKWIAEAHGGKITVESAIQQGTKFTIKLNN